MCFAHWSTGSVRARIGAEAAAAFGGLTSVVDGCIHAGHNRWNRDLPAAVTVRPGEEVQQLSDPAPGRDNTGAPYLQLFHFERGQTGGFATFVGSDTGTQARIPIAPFMGILGTAPLRTGMYRTHSGGVTDVRQFVRGTRLLLPVHAEGAKFSAGDGHMAQGDGEVTGTAVETLMACTLRFGIIRNRVIAGPRAVVPAADPTQLALTEEMLRQGCYVTTGAGRDLLENARTAVREMVDWLVVDRGVSLHEAYTLCSVAGDLKISETVDRRVSLTFPRGVFV